MILKREGDSGEGSRIEFLNSFNWNGKFEEELKSFGFEIMFLNEYALAEIDADCIYVGGFAEGGKRALELCLDSKVTACFALDLQSKLEESLLDKLKSIQKPIALSGGEAAQNLSKAVDSAFMLDTVENEEAPASSAIEAVAKWLVAQTNGKKVQTSKADVMTNKQNVPKKTYTLRQLDDATSYEAVFQVPVGTEDLFYKYPVACRGAVFSLQKCGSGQLKTTFLSPSPEATADAIALRLRARFDDPLGAAGDQACPLS